jgi:nucleotide-binding universal stress UspA family protein
MVKATVNFTEQLEITNQLLAEISKSTTFLESYIKQADGLPKVINELAEKKPYDIIVMGHRGRMDPKTFQCVILARGGQL